MAFLGATAFCVLVAVDTVAEIAAPRPNWKDVALCEADAHIEASTDCAQARCLILGQGASPLSPPAPGSEAVGSNWGREVEISLLERNRP